MLERSKKRARKNEWNKGYFQALSGILLAQKSNDDRYLFLPGINPTNKNELESYRRDFSEHTRDMVHADYDRGFFSAWNDYVKVLLKLSHGEKSKKVKRKVEKTVDDQSTQVASEVQIKPKTTVQTKLV